jgi:uncharacterized membrane protein SpoIIM required for sporulation
VTTLNTTPSAMSRLPGAIAASVSSAHYNLGRALIVTRREVRDMSRDWRIIFPIVTLTLIFPAIANWGAGRMVRFVEHYGADIVGERLVPFLLMVVGFFPISFSLVIALETFVGEKERHSLEPLLATPLTNAQLYIGKMLSSTLPPLVGSALGIGVYLAGLYFNIGWRPSLVLLAQITLLTVVQAVAMVAGAVIVSSQTTSVRAANLLASFIIIPFAFLVQGEAIIMFWAQYSVLWWILFGLVVVNVILIRMGVRIFNREELLGREIDELNLIRSARKLGDYVLGAGREGRLTVWAWYRREVLGTIPRLRGALAVMLIATLGAVYVGYQQAHVYRIPAQAFQFEQLRDQLGVVFQAFGLQGAGGISWVLVHNIRVLVLASLLGVFSFGVMAVVIIMLPIALLAYFGAQFHLNGLDPTIFWMAVAPHSLFEIPAALLAGALALRVGASLIAPPPGKTVGEGWLMALADAIRLWLGLVLPLLLVAAIVEVMVTPRLVLVVLGGG